MSVPGEEVQGPPQLGVRASPPLPRTAKQVIDQAIKDNRRSGVLLFGLLTAYALAGLAALAWGVVKGEAIPTIAGAISGFLLWPAISQAREVRRENLAIRMMGVPLGMAASAEEATNSVREIFKETFLSESASQPAR